MNFFSIEQLNWEHQRCEKCGKPLQPHCKRKTNLCRSCRSSVGRQKQLKEIREKKRNKTLGVEL